MIQNGIVADAIRCLLFLWTTSQILNVILGFSPYPVSSIDNNSLFSNVYKSIYCLLVNKNSLIEKIYSKLYRRW